jgi:hypothetical protein
MALKPLELLRKFSFILQKRAAAASMPIRQRGRLWAE